VTYPVLARADDALTPAEQEELLRDRVGEGVLETLDSNGTFTVTVSPDAWVATARACKDDALLAYDMFDCLFGVDRGEDGFDVVAILYSTSRGQRILLRVRCDGGRENPVCPSIVDLYAGANWMERETWDMFGIDFDGHPGLTPRILCAENFEGWPLRKDFYLASREAKPWPGVKEPAELDDEGNPIVKIPGPGEAVGPSILDEVMAEQAKIANPQASPPVAKPDPAEAPDSPQPEPAAQTTAGPDHEPSAAADEPDAPSEPPAVDAVTADERAAKDADDAAAAAARAELSRMQQAEARAQKAQEQAATGSDVPVDGPAIPEGQTADLRDEGGLDERDESADDSDDGGGDAEEDR
jgi:NADH-quinone oxidoreductase subunit C